MARSTGKPDCEIKRAKKILRRSSLEEQKQNGSGTAGKRSALPLYFKKDRFSWRCAWPSIDGMEKPTSIRDATRESKNLE